MERRMDFGDKMNHLPSSSNRSIQNGNNNNSNNNNNILDENCLICNSTCYNINKSIKTKSSTSIANNLIQEGDPREIREVLYRAFDIHVHETYFEETETDLPLCSVCILKCGQLKNVAIQLGNLQREYNRLREDIAFSIVDTVASSGNSRNHSGNSSDKNLPNSIYKKVRHCEVELIQQLIFESWHDRFPTELEGDDSYLVYNEDKKVQIEKDLSSQNLKVETEIISQKPNSVKPTSPSSSISMKSSCNTPVGKTTLISITTRDEKPSTSMRRRTIDSDESGSTIEKNVEINLKKRQITITNEKGAIVNNSRIGLADETKPMVVHMSPGQIFPKEEFCSSPDYLIDDSDFDDADLDAEYDMEQLVTPQLNLSSELLNQHSGDRLPEGKAGKKSMKFPHDLEITEWSRSSDESQQRLLLDYDHLAEDEDGRIDDITLDDFEEGTLGRRNGRSLSTSSENHGQNSNDLEFQQNEEGLYVCMFCSKTFIHKYPYRDHLKTHTGEGPRCPLCNKIFPKNHNLMLHMRTHTGEKPYKCEVCRKGFADKSNLKVHMRVHTGERPYKCEYCDQAFVNSSRLVVHRRLHTGEKPFPCDLCARSFSTSNQLQSHRKIHFTGKPFTCELCGKGYTNITSLTAHMNHSHNTTL